MADDPSQQPNISRLRINLDDDEAVSRWAERLGISPEQLRQAARSIPPTVRDIQQYLGLDQWAENLRQDFAVSGLPQITTTPATADVVRRALSPPTPLGGTATRGTDWTYDLHVFGTKPKVLPLEQFGELAKRLADLLGSREHVRFAGLRSGSARLLVKVDDQAQQDVQVQLMRMQQGTVASHSAKAANVDSYLASIGLHAELRDRAGAVVLEFPGATERIPEEEIRTVQQIDTLTGQVIKIGGRDETVPLTLRVADGTYVDVTVRGKDLAKRLAPLLFGQEVRVAGLATWRRDGNGEWSCVGMVVDSFEVPDATLPSQMFSTLSELPENGWHSLDDPISEWRKLRGDE